MAKRQKEWARRARIELMALLGGCCSKCGSTKKLEFDCIEPRGDAHHRMSVDRRMSFYRQQHRENNLQILCRRKCHKKKSKQELETTPW